jgi:hypothetical protein
MAVRAHDGSFDNAAEAFSRVTTWLVDNADRVPRLGAQYAARSTQCQA